VRLKGGGIGQKVGGCLRGAGLPVPGVLYTRVWRMEALQNPHTVHKVHTVQFLFLVRNFT